MILAACGILLGVLGASPDAATTVIWEQRFDAAGLPGEFWTLKGGAEIRDGALRTVTVPEAHSQAIGKSVAPIPSGLDGYLLRLEWYFTPVRTGGWGQDTCVSGGPVVVEIGGNRPVLNTKHPAKDTITVGEAATLSCDFNRQAVFSWCINGKEQLDAPVPAWMSGASEAAVSFSDFKETNSETLWKWVRISKVIPTDPLPVRLSGWDDLPNVAPEKPAAFLVGVNSPMDKVFREAADYTGNLGGKVKIAAAGRERESFQLTCIPAGASVKKVNVETTDLLHADGKARLAAERMAWHPVGYVQTVKSNSSIRRTGWWWPDVLLPAKPFDVEAGFVQPLWFTVDVPADANPGVYRGFITLRAEAAEPVVVGVELTVRAFSLPVRGTLKTAFCMNPGIWEMWYHPDEVKKRLGMSDTTNHGPLYTSNECSDILPQAKWHEIYDFLLAHRLSPTVIYSGLKNGKSRTVPAREDMEYCYERGMNATCLANCDVLPGDAAAADNYMAQLEAYLRDWEGFVQSKHWPDMTWYVHGFDESEMRPNPAETVDPSINRVYGMIGEKFPWCKRETANPFHAKHVGRFDIWTPLTAQLSGDLTPYRERQAAGSEAWAYVCCGPGKPYANLFIDFPGVDPRILGWQFFQYKLTGFLYYLIDFYEPETNWNMNAPKWPEKAWNTLSFNTNSDGILIYPGPDASPLASTRLENLRDGIEDYEALAVLRGLTEQLAAKGGHEEVLASTRDVLNVRPEVSKSWTEYTQEPARIRTAREEVDGLIETILPLL